MKTKKNNSALIEKLTSITEEDIDLEGVMKKFGEGLDLEEDYKLYDALYLDFEDNDYLHDTSPYEPIYINDFDFNVDESREQLKELMSVELNTNTFESIASCSCSTGGLKGNYLLGSNRVCKVCGNPVEKFIEKVNYSKLWLKTPQGVERFVSLGVYNTLMKKIRVGKEKPICLPQYFISGVYRRKMKKENKGTDLVVGYILEDLGIKEVSLNSFYRNYSRIMEYLLIGEGLKQYTKLASVAPVLYEVYQRTLNVAFCKYLKIPNSLSTIIERNQYSVYSTKNQLEVTRCLIDIANTKKDTEYNKLSERDYLANCDVTGKALVHLSEIRNNKISKEMLFGKKRLARSHVSTGSVPFTGRNVITSETGISNPSEIVIPWKSALITLQYHLTNILYRKGLTPKQVIKKLNLAGYKHDGDIAEIFRKARERCELIIQSGRNPSNEYLSLRAFLGVVNESLEDDSIRIHILTCGEYNADFDGDNIYFVVLIDDESKAKAYGALGHQQMLDKHKLFCVGPFAGQTKTNLTNLNVMMSMKKKEMASREVKLNK